MSELPTNRLANETSPYLLQHRDNPVDWYPWGEEAIRKAREADKPIFLSVGYSACHWCHVMAHESFENEAIAELMNEYFVSVKVDREERPDVDAIYMEAVQMMAGQGGWPMSVFLFPDLRPFYGGTYFPPEDKFGRPGFKSVLLRVAEIYRTRRGELENNAGKLTESIRQISAVAPSEALPGQEVIDKAVAELRGRADRSWGGFGSAPKFPPSMALMLLLRQWRRTGEEELLKMVELTLQRMALGGMYDQLGGGFHRYSVDAIWLVPHFEKMLYDNALLAKVYLEGYQATGNAFYRSIAEDTLNYTLREMTAPAGGFYSAQDADSEGEEGKFFVWTPQEIAAAVGEKDGGLFCRFYGVSPEGNFEGKNILHIRQPPQAFMEEEGIDEEDLFYSLQRARQKLFEAREKRVKPGLDDKVLASWNGLMIGAMAVAGRVLERGDYVEAARRAASFVLGKMRGEKGLLRTHRAGESKLNAYLDDYAFLLCGLIDLYEASFEMKWLKEAEALAEEMRVRYWDAESGAFFFTSNDHEELIVRKRTAQDGAIPSGNSMAALGLMRLGVLTGEAKFSGMAAEVIRAWGQYLDQAPGAFHMMLVALDFRLHPPVEIALVGAPEGEDTRAALRAVDSAFVPNKVLAFRAAEDEAEDTIPLLRGKRAEGGAATVYLCENYACRAPMTDPDAVRAALRPAGADGSS
ncbi:MAG: thioredoxin domain-containing protein [bacterium]|nr:thioredoxin domain-containing protein [bacterium]